MRRSAGSAQGVTIMKPLAWVMLLAAACGEDDARHRFPDARLDAPSGRDAGGAGDATSPGDAAQATLRVTTSTPRYTVHAGDARTLRIVVTNEGAVAVTAPALAVTGLTLGTMPFAHDACATSGGLPPGGTCTAVGMLAASTLGRETFQVTATASPDATGAAPVALEVRAAAAAICGPAGASNCAATALVPGNAAGAGLAGEPFLRYYDVAADGLYAYVTFPATVSDFRLDTYEVTVGRFREFVRAGQGTQAAPPAAGDGAHAAIPGSGWDPAWNGLLATDTSALTSTLTACAGASGWTDAPGANEAMPMGCLTYYEAMAFCAWDGGYLPTELEWRYAAAGGAEQRAYPWSVPAGSLTIDTTFATYYDLLGDYPPVTPAGRKPSGNGRWGHADLGGNVWERALDGTPVVPPVPCDDCADLMFRGENRILGGCNASELGELRTEDVTGHIILNSRNPSIGLRCATWP